MPEQHASNAKVLKASDGLSNDAFGYSVAIDSRTVAVGAHGSDPLGTNSGKAYVFRRKAGEWIQQDILIPSDGEDHAGNFSGAAYLFQFQGNEWTQAKKFTAPAARPSDWFGNSVGIDGNMTVVGAQSYEGATINSGAAFVFELKKEN